MKSCCYPQRQTHRADRGSRLKQAGQDRQIFQAADHNGRQGTQRQIHQQNGGSFPRRVV